MTHSYLLLVIIMLMEYTRDFYIYRVHKKKTLVYLSCSAGENTCSMSMAVLPDISGMLESTGVKYLDWAGFRS